MRLVWLAGLCLGMSVAGVAQAPQSKTDPEVKAEYEQAKKVYDASNFVAALPLFEDLYAQRPQELAYEEGLAMSLQGAANNMAPDAGKAAYARSKLLLLDAQSKGDNSPLLTTLLEKMGDGDGSSAVPTAPMTPAVADFAQAEKLFSNGDMKAALALYQKALGEDPTFYLAALYSGDALFKAGDCAQAGVYYAKAVAIDPDRETAYRYWADCLVKLGERTKAEEMYIHAVVAQPYAKTTRQSLQTWAAANHARIFAPQAQLPAEPSKGKDGNTQITLSMPPKGGDDPNAGAALAYSMQATLWQWTEFKKHYPNEKTYRHSLPEEAASIRSMLEVKIPEKKLSPSLQTLMALEKDGMLECWILLDNPDQGVAQDYATYRKDHRELMAQYIAKYDVHPM
jgi:tetratricopeptide (TPR) repeat protein